MIALRCIACVILFIFFFNDTATTEIYTLSLHDALPISHARTLARLRAERAATRELGATCHTPVGIHADGDTIRGFAGLPDGSAWVVDAVALGESDGDGDGEPGRTLARRMLATGAADLLRDAEAMSA